MNVFPGLSAFGSAFWILQFACPLFDVLVEVDDLVIVFFVHEWGGDHEVGGRAVVGDRDIVDLGDAEESFYVRVMWKSMRPSTIFAPICWSPPRGPLL